MAMRPAVQFVRYFRFKRADFSVAVALYISLLFNLLIEYLLTR